MPAAALVLGALIALAAPARVHEGDYPDDYQAGVRYDEYPVVVPKRTALLLDRIMVALQKAVDDEKGGQYLPSHPLDHKIASRDRPQQQQGRNYWRCYFNAVTCFKRK